MDVQRSGMVTMQLPFVNTWTGSAKPVQYYQHNTTATIYSNCTTTADKVVRYGLFTVCQSFRLLSIFLSNILNHQ
jgi:hypothetical protein